MQYSHSSDDRQVNSPERESKSLANLSFVPPQELCLDAFFLQSVSAHKVRDMVSLFLP